MMDAPNLSGMPAPSAGQLLGTVWLVWSMLLRTLWPLLVLLIGGKLLLVWLERVVVRRRARRWYQAVHRKQDALFDDVGFDPSGLRLVGDAAYPPDWDVLRRQVYRRANYRCQNCGADDVELHAHHIVPLSVGGTNALSNLACLCRACHAALHPHVR